MPHRRGSFVDVAKTVGKVALREGGKKLIDIGRLRKEQVGKKKWKWSKEICDKKERKRNTH